MSHHEHYRRAREELSEPLRCGIITISSTRTAETDTSGAAIRTLLEQEGHRVVRYDVVSDDPSHIMALVQDYGATGCQAVITNGGTGITKHDQTFEAISGMLEKPIPGFGEIFRMLSYQEIGSAAMLSRATAGIYQKMLVFCLPGSAHAVQLAMEKLVLPELVHLVWEMQRW